MFRWLVAASICTMNLCCQDIGITPDYMKPGRRDYAWTVDTLRVRGGDFSLPTCIWGSASDDVWIGDNGSPGRLWHFDGSSWSPDSVHGTIAPLGLWGFGARDIWLTNSSGTIWRYDGIEWYQHARISVSGFQRVFLQGIWGIQPDDIWAVGSADVGLDGGSGYKGVILHWDGSSWQFEPIPTTTVSFGIVSHDRYEGLFFVDGYRFDPAGDTCKVYLYDGIGSLTQIYSDARPMTIHEIRARVYFVSAGKIYQYHGGSLRIWTDLSNENYAGWMAGRSELDFFGAGKGGEIVHYNGSNIATLFPNHFRILNMFVVGDSLFVLCVDLNGDNEAYVIHGKLI